MCSMHGIVNTLGVGIDFVTYKWKNNEACAEPLTIDLGMQKHKQKYLDQLSDSFSPDFWINECKADQKTMRSVLSLISDEIRTN